jgi:hypothetical protein
MISGSMKYENWRDAIPKDERKDLPEFDKILIITAY